MENTTPPARQAPPVAATVATAPAPAAPAQSQTSSSSGWTDTTNATPPSNSIQLGPADTRPWLGGTLGFATDNLDFDLGARDGVTLSNRIYIGGSFVYHIGSWSSSSAQGASLFTYASDTVAVVKPVGANLVMYRSDGIATPEQAEFHR